MIAPGDVVVIRKTDPIVVLREKGNIRASRNLLMRAEAYDTVRHMTVCVFSWSPECGHPIVLLTGYLTIMGGKILWLDFNPP